MQHGASPVSGTTGPSVASSSPSNFDSNCWTYEVTERDIRRFLQAIGELTPLTAAAAEDTASEPPALTAPPLFFQVMAWQDVGPEHLSADGAPAEIQGGPPQARSMGGASDFTVLRQVRAGERIRVCSTLLGVECRQGRQGPLHLVSRQTTFTDAAGVEVARELATYVRRAA